MVFVPFLFPGGVLLILHFKCIWNGTFSNLQKAYGGGISKEGSYCPAWREAAADTRLRGRKNVRKSTAPVEKGPWGVGIGFGAMPSLLGLRSTTGACPFHRTHKSLHSLAIPTSSHPFLSSQPLFCPKLVTCSRLSLETLFSPFLSFQYQRPNSHGSVISSLETFLTNSPGPTSALIPSTEIMLPLCPWHLFTLSVGTHIVLYLIIFGSTKL